MDYKVKRVLTNAIGRSGRVGGNEAGEDFVTVLENGIWGQHGLRDAAWFAFEGSEFIADVWKVEFLG